MHPESQLLLLSAAGNLRHPAVERLLEGGIDWPRLAALAVHQKAPGVFWRQLTEAGIGPRVPAEVAEALRRHAMVADFKQARLEQRLTALIALLERAGIRVLLLKGAALGHTVYPSFRDRPMGDLDIMVAPERAQEARSLLLQHGWRTTVLQERRDFYAIHQHLAPLEDADGVGLRLDIHTDLFFAQHPFQLPREKTWAASGPIQVGQATAWTLDAPHTLLHVCVHFVWSHMVHLGVWRTFRDLYHLTERSTFDWEQFCDLAARSRAASCCYWTLRLAQSLADLNVPQPVLTRLQPPGSSRLLARIERHFAAGVLPSPAPCPSVQLARLMWRLAVRPAWSGHGRIVPWRYDELVQQKLSGEPAAGGLEKLRLHLQGLDRWRRYLVVVLRSPPSPVALPEG